jgi:hypothetical protein
MQQPNIEALLERSDGVAQRRTRYAERVGRALKAEVLRDPREGLQIGEARVDDWCTSFTSSC